MCRGKSIDAHGKINTQVLRDIVAHGKSMVKKIPVRYQFFTIVRVPKYIYLAGQMPCIGR